MHSLDITKILQGLSLYTKEDFHLGIDNIEVADNYIKIHFQASDYTDEEHKALFLKHLHFLDINHFSIEPFYETECNNDGVPTGNKFYKHSQLIAFFGEY